MPPRVVHLSKYYPPAVGGIETHVQTLAQAQAALGADVLVLAVNHRDRAGRDVTHARLSRTPTAADADGRVRVERVGRVVNLAKLDVSPGLVRALRREVRRGPAVWHLHAPNPAMMVAALAVPAARPLVVTHHCDIVAARPLRLAFAPVEWAAFRASALVLTDSPPYAEGSAVLRRLGGKVRSLPLGLDLTPYFQPSPTALRYAADLAAAHPGPIWLSVGRLIPYKGLTHAVAALSRVPGTWVVSGTGPQENELRRQAAAAGVADRVKWLGRTTADELVGCYHAATATWFPSVTRNEGFGLVQVEAMASGCPVINTAVPGSGVAWVCRHDREGLTVPVADPTALAAAANRLLTEPGLRDRLAAAGRERAAAEFDWQVMGRRSLEFYRSVCHV